MKPGKHQRSKQRCQDLCWKVHDRAKSFFCTHTLCMNYVTKTFLLVSYSVSSIQQLCFAHGQGQKREQKHTAKNFVEFHNNPLLLIITMPILRLLELTLVKLLAVKVAVSLAVHLKAALCISL